MFQIRELSSSASRSYRKKSTDISWWQVKTVMLAGGKLCWAQGTGLGLRRSLHCCKSRIILPLIELKGPCKEHGAGKQRALSALRGV